MNEQDLLSIKKFSDLTGISQSKLRYYDELKLFQPIKRGENGYRYYTASQAIAVNCINVMQHLKIPIKRIFDARHHETPRQFLDILKNHELELNKELFRLQQAYALIHAYTELISEGLNADENAITTVYMTEKPIEIGELNDYSSGYFYDSFFKFIGKMKEKKIDSAYPVGGFYDSMDIFLEKPGEPSRFFSQFPTGRDKKEAGEYLVGYARGNYGKLGDLPERMKNYAKENNIAVGGPVYEIYLFDEIVVDDPNRFLIQVSVPIKNKRK
ncbi:MAG: MerR family DNA-binding transcriptional regulator [Oscillospiraceae bacterium]|nr:MerR family DNA-binding transcriptional regulator [Oscillospiraceae bacterium]